MLRQYFTQKNSRYSGFERKRKQNENDHFKIMFGIYIYKD